MKKKDWNDELGSNKRQRKRHRQNRNASKNKHSEQGKDEYFAKTEEDHFLSNLEAKSGAFNSVSYTHLTLPTKA